MIQWLFALLGLFAAGSTSAQALCSDAWYRSIDAKVSSGDGQGHGPDLGSDEWKSTIEFKLGVRGKPGVPPRGSPDWCGHIDRLARAHASARPSFACAKVRPGSVPALVCGDRALSALDRKLAGVYAAASRKAFNERPPRLKTEHAGWIKGRDACGKSGNVRECVETEYMHRIAELQARYRLVAGTGPVRYVCDGNPSNEVIVTFFQTQPPTLVAERGDSVSLMFVQRSGSGAKYQGRNETFWEHQGEAAITWGYGAPEMRCKPAR